MKTILKSIIFLLLFFHFNNVNSQSSKLNEEIIQYFDSIYGADNLLINGKIFMYPNYRAKGNPYFYGKDLKLCDVYINNRKFSDLTVNYNLVEDKLIVSTNINNNNINFELNNHLVDSFNITHFVFNTEIDRNTTSNIASLYNNSKELLFKKKFIKTEKLGFCEIIYDGKNQLINKYYKTFSDKVTQEHSHGTFTNQKSKLHIFIKNEMFVVNNKRKFINTFIASKKEIKEFLKKNKIKYKNANNDELHKLMIFCENLN